MNTIGLKLKATSAGASFFEAIAGDLLEVFVPDELLFVPELEELEPPE